MANTKTSDETAASALDGTELVRIVQTGNSRRTTTQAIADLGTGAAFSGALVKKANDQNTADYTTATAITWDSEVYDEGGWHESVTNPSRLTVPSGVTRVRVSTGVVLGNVTGDLWVLLSIRKGGSASFDGYTAHRSETGSSPHVTITSPVYAVSAGDYFEAFLQLETDTSITVTAATAWFAIEKVS
jgi:hypothetical protein